MFRWLHFASGFAASAAFFALPTVSADAQLSVPHTETIAGVSCRVVTGEQTGGPVVLIIGGDTQTKLQKTADGYAVQQMGDWPLLRGKMIFVSAAAESPNTHDVPAFMRSVRPDWVVSLRDEKAAKIPVVRVVVAENAAPDVQNEARKLQGSSSKKPVSSARSSLAAPPAPLNPFEQAAVLERPLVYVVAAGSGSHPAPSVRTRHLRRTVARLLGDLHMVGTNAENAMLPPSLAPAIVRVAMYDSDGAAGAGPGAMEAALSAQTDVCFRRVCATDIQTGVLGQFDVLINPGGGASTQSRNLSGTGRAAVQKFIAGGGGYLGICAGCYLASSGYKWSLGLVDADVADKRHAYRGRAMLQMELTPKGHEVFGNLPQSVLTVIYHNGPVLTPTGKREASAFEPLAVYRTEISQKRGKKNIMVGSAAIAADRFGKGRVIGISPHPEQTPGLTEMVPRAVRWLASKSPKQTP